MGGIVSFGKKSNTNDDGGLFRGLRARKKDEIPPPLSTAKEILASKEALSRVKAGLEFAPPGTVFRWEKLLKFVNRKIEPTPEVEFPLQIEIDMEQLRLVLQNVYEGIKSVSSDGIVLMREYLPKMYDKHSVERGRRVSQKEREEKNISDECYAYGEIDYEVFASIYMKVSSAYGCFTNGCFYDLGCGVGIHVYAAAMIGSFVKCSGVENIEALCDRGSKRLARWNKYKMEFPRKYREIEITFAQDNFLECTFYSEATFVLLHWTAFSRDQQEAVRKILDMCREGLICVSFTHPIPSTDYEVLIKDSCETSWGHCDFYVQEKMTAARNRR